MPDQQDVVFNTVDGLKLAGRVYPAAQFGPAVILTPGVCDTHSFSLLSWKLNLADLIWHYVTVRVREGDVHS